MRYSMHQAFRDEPFAPMERTEFSVHDIARENMSESIDAVAELPAQASASTILACIGCTQRLRLPLGRGLLEVACPTCKGSWYWHSTEADEIGSVDDLAPGTHLVTPRTGYSHHGLYVGGGHVVHYAGLSDGLKAAPVALATLAEFCGSRDFFVKEHPTRRFSATESIARAKSRLGESHYHVATNNCEHFCEWAIHGDHDSAQVDKAAGATGPSAGTIAGLAARGIVASAGAVTGLSGPGIMSGLATVGSAVGGGAVAGLGILGAAPGLAMASLVNNTLLADNEAHDDDERKSRSIGRAASYAGAASGAAGSIAAVSALGTAGLSGAGITSGLAAIGGTVGGGMAAGVTIATAAPALVAVAAGYGIYKLVKWARN